MYRVTGQDLTLLDTVTVEGGWYPRVDGHSKQVYIPHGTYRGVSVIGWDDTRLTTPRVLKCVDRCVSVGVLSPHTLCACDRTSGSVSVVSVTDDAVTATLQKPLKVRGQAPYLTAVLGGSVLVMYEGHSPVVYNGVSQWSQSPGTAVTRPAGLQFVRGVSSDGVSRFFLCDPDSTAVYILDVSGQLCDKVNIDTASLQVWDCTVGDGKLWVGCHNGDIVIMSPQ